MFDKNAPCIVLAIPSKKSDCAFYPLVYEVGPMKRIPSANYSLSIALPGKCSTSHVLDPGDAWKRLW